MFKDYEQLPKPEHLDVFKGFNNDTRTEYIWDAYSHSHIAKIVPTSKMLSPIGAIPWTEIDWELPNPVTNELDATGLTVAGGGGNTDTE